MNNWKTVLSIDLIQDAYLIRLKLEDNGFQVNLLDELSTQIAPHLTAATGGVRIQVLESDWEAAFLLLTELGYFNEETVPKGNLVGKITRFTSKVPGLNKMRPEVQLLVLVSIVFTLVIVVFAIVNGVD